MSTPTAETAALVEFDRVSVHGATRLALADVSLRFARSELALLTGPGGAGKSLLLRLIAGIARPTGGVVRVAGQPVAAMKPAALALLRRSMGIVSDELPLLAGRSLRDNVELPALLAGVGRAEARLRADAALARVGLDGAQAAQRVERLAGGDRQRGALARAIVNRPALLLLDRPTLGLGSMGPCGVLEVQGIHVVVISDHVEPNDLAPFTAVGIAPELMQFVMLKSRIHWRAGLRSLAHAVVECAGTGVCTSDYSKLDFRKVRRPIYPLDGV